MHTSMNWNDLRYFLAVRRSGTLLGAARELGVEHTTISRRIAALERDVGATLFTRAPDGLTPTAAGEALLPHAEAMERAADAAHRHVKGHDTRIEGTVRVTTSEAFAGFLVRGLAPLRERHPALVIDLFATNRQVDLLRGEADVAVRLAPTTHEDLVLRRVGDTGWSLYAANGYLERRGRPASVESLAGHEVIHFDSSLARIPGASWLGDGRGATVAVRANGLIPALNATIAGFGLGVLPCLLGDAEPALVRLTEGSIATCEVFLVVHRDLQHVASMRAVLEFLHELLKREARRLSGVT
jgi:DNA-binding transcriptional LysR family regulator